MIPGCEGTWLQGAQTKQELRADWIVNRELSRKYQATIRKQFLSPSKIAYKFEPYNSFFNHCISFAETIDRVSSSLKQLIFVSTISVILLN